MIHKNKALLLVLALSSGVAFGARDVKRSFEEIFNEDVSAQGVKIARVEIQQTSTGNTLLQHAILHGSLKNVEKILAHEDCNEQFLMWKNIAGQTALHLAVEKGDLEIVKALLAKEVALNAPSRFSTINISAIVNKEKKSSVELAIEKKHQRILEAFQAHLNDQKKYSTFNVGQMLQKIAQALKDLGLQKQVEVSDSMADFDVAEDRTETTTEQISVAVEKNAKELEKEEEERKKESKKVTVEDYKRKDSKTGKTTLHDAIESNDIARVQTILSLERSAIVSKEESEAPATENLLCLEKDSSGKTPLEVAQGSSPEIMSLLINHMGIQEVSECCQDKKEEVTLSLEKLQESKVIVEQKLQEEQSSLSATHVLGGAGLVAVFYCMHSIAQEMKTLKKQLKARLSEEQFNALSAADLFGMVLENKWDALTGFFQS